MARNAALHNQMQQQQQQQQQQQLHSSQNQIPHQPMQYPTNQYPNQANLNSQPQPGYPRNYPQPSQLPGSNLDYPKFPVQNQTPTQNLPDQPPNTQLKFSNSSINNDFTQRNSISHPTQPQQQQQLQQQQQQTNRQMSNGRIGVGVPGYPPRGAANFVNPFVQHSTGPVQIQNNNNNNLSNATQNQQTQVQNQAPTKNQLNKSQNQITPSSAVSLKNNSSITVLRAPTSAVIHPPQNYSSSKQNSQTTKKNSLKQESSPKQPTPTQTSPPQPQPTPDPSPNQLQDLYPRRQIYLLQNEFVPKLMGKYL